MEQATELPWLWAGLGAYALATVTAFANNFRARPERGGSLDLLPGQRIELSLLMAGILLLCVTLTVRWLRIGHGPFVNLFELLISQLFSLGIVYSLIYWRWSAIRPASIVVLPIVWILGSWVLTLEPKAPPFPPTYYNPWLWAHVGAGKIFLGILLVATGLAGVLLLRRLDRLKPFFSRMPDDDTVDHLAWRLMVLALVFDSMMLVFGAVWAQDAWGRFWQWDALETSAFLTWLSIGLGIHVRLAYRVPRTVTSAFIIVAFCLAFATYFSTPFVSEAAHKGVI